VTAPIDVKNNYCYQPFCGHSTKHGLDSWTGLIFTTTFCTADDLNSCLRYSCVHLCSHVIAVAENNKELEEVLNVFDASSVMPNLTMDMPKGEGRKQIKRHRVETYRDVTGRRKHCGSFHVWMYRDVPGRS
jgi:hypothetical protein